MHRNLERERAPTLSHGGEREKNKVGETKCIKSGEMGYLYPQALEPKTTQFHLKIKLSGALPRNTGRAPHALSPKRRSFIMLQMHLGALPVFLGSAPHALSPKTASYALLTGLTSREG